ncbi:hypothetical protein ACOME3_008035 [Neoechinorhynchus agilis]
MNRKKHPTFDEYMMTKRSKLNEQFQNIPSKNVTEIFKGISVYVNGMTDPDATEIRRLMKIHGGCFETYYSRNKVTHVIASQLSFSKQQQWTVKQPIVSAAWITESIGQNRLLPYQKYLISRKEAFRNYIHQPLTAADPEFVKEFFSKSRLHLISSMANEMKNYVYAKQQKDGIVFKRDSIVQYIHVDIDSFFASVAIRDNPDLKGKPVVVTHSSRANDNSHADIASCSYEARFKGVRNGMWVGQAMKICPNLVCVPYDFEAYSTTSRAFYDRILHYARTQLDTCYVEAVSCDEAILCIASKFSHERYADVLSSIELWIFISVLSALAKITYYFYFLLLNTFANVDANDLKVQIEQATNGCTCSLGVGKSRVLARLALRMAKPNGVYFGQEDLLDKTLMKDLPGIGYSLIEKIETAVCSHSLTCSALKEHLTKERLKSIVGEKYGVLQESGKDNMKLTSYEPKKTHSVTINYGVRIVSNSEFRTFIDSLSVELCSRLQYVALYESTKKIMLRVTLRKRHPQAPVVTQKYMGLGRVEEVSGSSLIKASKDPGYISRKVQLCIKRDEKLSQVPVQTLSANFTKSRKCDNEEAIFKQERPLSIQQSLLIKPIPQGYSLLGHSLSDNENRTFYSSVPHVSQPESRAIDPNQSQIIGLEEVIISPLSHLLQQLPSSTEICKQLCDLWNIQIESAFELSLKLIDILVESKRYDVLSDVLVTLLRQSSCRVDKEPILKFLCDYGFEVTYPPKDDREMWLKCFKARKREYEQSPGQSSNVQYFIGHTMPLNQSVFTNSSMIPSGRIIPHNNPNLFQVPLQTVPYMVPVWKAYLPYMYYPFTWTSTIPLMYFPGYNNPRLRHLQSVAKWNNYQDNGISSSDDSTILDVYTAKPLINQEMKIDQSSSVRQSQCTKRIPMEYRVETHNLYTREPRAMPKRVPTPFPLTCAVQPIRGKSKVKSRLNGKSVSDPRCSKSDHSRTE